jgi:dATP pyrophosphohydrolase
MKNISDIIELHIIKHTKDGIKFLLLRRSEKEIYPGTWQMVSGRIEKNEKAYTAAVRELYEETGLVPQKMWVVPKINSYYNPELDTVSIIPVFLVEVASSSSVILSDEHDRFMWVNSTKAKNLLAWPGQRETVDIITEYLQKRKNFLKFVEIPTD